MFIYPKKPVCHLNMPKNIKKTPFGVEITNQVNQAFSNIVRDDGLRHFVVDVDKYGALNFKLADNDSIMHKVSFKITDVANEAQLDGLQEFVQSNYLMLKAYNHINRLVKGPRRFLGIF